MVRQIWLIPDLHVGRIVIDIAFRLFSDDVENFQIRRSALIDSWLDFPTSNYPHTTEAGVTDGPRIGNSPCGFVARINVYTKHLGDSLAMTSSVMDALFHALWVQLIGDLLRQHTQSMTEHWPAEVLRQV